MIRNLLTSAVQKKSFLMFFTSVTYILGLIAYFSGNSIPISFLIILFGILAIIKNYLSPKLVLFWSFIFFFGFFNASLKIKNSDALYQIAPQNANIQGQIVSIPSNNHENTKRFFVEVSQIKYNGNLEKIKSKTLVTIYSRDKSNLDFNIGNTYNFKGKLRIPLKASNPSQFNYRKYLKNFGVFTTFYADGNKCSLSSSKLKFKWKFLQKLNDIRNDIIDIHSKYLKSPNLEILGGIVFGDDAVSTPNEIKKSFQHSGLLHILAASGMNVALIYGIWFFILRKLRVPFNLTISSGIFVIFFYAMMTGLGPSVIRATFMLIFILLGKLIDRNAHSISLLSFVALLMLIYNPSYINDVSFQLSFMVTFGLLATAPVLFDKVKFMPNWLSGAIFIPIIAQIWVAPIQMYYFNSLSIYSIFANIASLPFVTVISFGGFVSVVLSLIKPLANQVCFLFDFVMNPILNTLVNISNYFANLPHSLLQMPKPSIVQVFLYYIIVLLITFLFKIDENSEKIVNTSSPLEKEKKEKIFPIRKIIIMLFALLFFISYLPHHNKKFETITFDVQNADAFLIKTPQNKYFIIDSGKMGYREGKTQAKMIILGYLKDRGIKNIEGFIITHFDSDHAGGAVDLIENLNIKNVYVNSLNDKSHLAKEIYNCTNAKNNLKLVKNNEIIYKNKTFIIKNFFANLKDKNLNDKFDNENSIITLVSDADFNELFMGDAGIIGFEKIKKYLPNKIEILKVGHHGAKNVINKNFLDRINPEVAIISTGLNNYGHPNGVTIDLLRAHNIKILRTDYQNSIKIDEFNNKYNVSTYNDGKYITTNLKQFQ